ncbi:MAG TPA: hypothetical protein EYN70_05305 [Planctomycetaceae bacterium]|nr:hypothetical protein [Planctomycetaceae bacterium]
MAVKSLKNWCNLPMNTRCSNLPYRIAKWFFPLLLLGSLLQTPVISAEELRLTSDGRIKRDSVFIDNGDTLVYVVDESSDKMRLMRRNMRDGSTEPFHKNAPKSEFSPAFSANGQYYAFIQSRGNLSLALVIRELQGVKSSEVKPAGGFSGMRSPAISPEGKRVLYCFPEKGSQQIWSVNMEAQDRKALTDGQGIDNWPAYTPDGKTIVFGSTRDGNYEIYSMRSDGKEVKRLTNSPMQDIRPVISHDGKRIAFISQRDGNRELYVMNLDGSGLQRVTRHPDRDDYPAWHPDGKHIALISERAGRTDLYLVQVSP